MSESIQKETIQKLSKLPEWKEVLIFLGEKILKLNSLDDLPGSELSKMTRAEDIALEVKARKRAVTILNEELSTFLFGDTERQLGGKASEYAVDVK